MTQLKIAKGSPEFDASVGEHKMFTYYVPGCCALRTFYGIDGKKEWNFSQNRPIDTQPTPAQVIEGMVRSGCGGSTMIFTDAYRGGKALTSFKEFVETNKLGTMTISPGHPNRYTGRDIYTGVFEYDIKRLSDWCKNNVEGMKEEVWKKEKWYSPNDRVGMDDVFYTIGGRPQVSNETVEEVD